MVVAEGIKNESFEMDASTGGHHHHHHYNNIGRTVKLALQKAQTESRLIVGLQESIKVLSKMPDEFIFCLLVQPRDGDSETHMHEVLLEAFCYENDIYVMKVDSAEKLSRILGRNSVESCCLIQRSSSQIDDEHNINMCEVDDKDKFYDEQLNQLENTLVDHCEANWDAPQKPIISLPGK